MPLKLNKQILFLLAMCSYALGNEDDYGPDYGSKWLLFVDENGTSHEMNFSALPVDTKHLRLGRVYFYLYTRQNVENGELLKIPKDDVPLQSKYFNESNGIRAITHGWLAKETAGWLQNMKNMLLQSADTNVLTIDWHELSQNPHYPWAALSTRYVGKRMAKLIRSLRKTYNLSETRIHLIGHSLGAQVMGYTGHFSKHKINRITGLDPARPLFELPMMHQHFRLEKSDAEFVDIIHTCAGLYGYKKSHGHADFYPNGGKASQPGCEGTRQKMEACSHGRSYEFFTESIESSNPFVAYPCESWDRFTNGSCRSGGTFMGYPANETYYGDFYLHTKNESTYAMNEESEE